MTHYPDSDDSFDMVDEKEYGFLSESDSSSSSGEDETRLNLDKFEETVAQAKLTQFVSKANVELAKTTPEDSSAESDSSESSSSSVDVTTAARKEGDIALKKETARGIERPETSTSESDTSETSSGSEDDEKKEDPSGSWPKNRPEHRNSLLTLTFLTYRVLYTKRAWRHEPWMSKTLETSSDSDDDEEDSDWSTESEEDEVEALMDELESAKEDLQKTRNELNKEQEEHKLTKAKLEQATSEADACKRQLQSATERFHIFNAEIKPKFEGLAARLAKYKVESKPIQNEQIAQLKSHNSDLQKMVKNFQGALSVKDKNEKAQNEKIDRLTEEVRLLRNALASGANLRKLYKEKVRNLVDTHRRDRAIMDQKSRDLTDSILKKVSVGETYTPSHVFCV
ncbi:hypothetical protein CAEBREN_15663 [Caenorhabditis brenneri]|uniref:Uncharacterized protein n=1 Tax=Caenorhabditis brenneri TaxID=135651 RepID=G0PGL3_CAEBE|nr:hypothetical protein CAEBREN_15663 [Caenorhabditis brenneri]